MNDRQGGLPPRYICIHGHFYQPPRENPWLETVEVQPGAAPYHDWNARITAECYGANANARILDDLGLIARIVSTYERISFNVGPTLLAWLQEQAPRVYYALLAADAQSQRRFAGHGSAMAQVYNHAIMPLCNRRDKYTQVRWGLRDFKSRFGRAPEGMWLAETAVDLETLDVLAEHGILFTVLAPHQAKLPAGSPDGAGVDTTRPYRVRLPSGRTIAIFFYDGPVSRAVAFEHLLGSGERFLSRLLSAFPAPRPPLASAHPQVAPAQLVHIATDGETYGHHHKFGEMALAYALDRLERAARGGDGPTLTNYGEFLSRHPPQEEIEIHENTSWSCAHGVDRWRADCGCNSGGNPGFHQRWRQPLRAALDALRDTITPLYLQQAAPLLRDPWAARDDYIDIILERAPRPSDTPTQPAGRSDDPDAVERGRRARSRFLTAHATRSLSPAEQQTVWHLLEMQRHSQLMYTSCGWFFDDISGPEPTQIMQYAGRVVQLAGALGAAHVAADFLSMLGQIPGNTAQIPDGAALYQTCVAQVATDLDHSQIAATHVALSMLASATPAEPAAALCDPEDSPPETADQALMMGRYALSCAPTQQLQMGGVRLSYGRIGVTSHITTSHTDLAFVALHAGGVHVTVGVRPVDAQPIADESLLTSFERGDLAAVLQMLQAQFPPRLFSLADLPPDVQRGAMQHVLTSALAPLQSAFSQLYGQQGLLLHRHGALTRLGLPIPRELSMATELSLSHDLHRALLRKQLHVDAVVRILEQATQLGVSIDLDGARRILEQTLHNRLQACEARASDPALLADLASAVEIGHLPSLGVDLWAVQNFCYELREGLYGTQRARNAAAWLRAFTQLATRLRIQLPDSRTAT